MNMYLLKTFIFSFAREFTFKSRKVFVFHIGVIVFNNCFMSRLVALNLNEQYLNDMYLPDDRAEARPYRRGAAYTRQATEAQEAVKSRGGHYRPTQAQRRSSG